MTTIPLQTTVTGSGPGIVLTHGAGGTVESNFGAIIPALAANHTVVGPDYPGDDTPLNLDELADTVVADAVAAGVETFSLLGFSLGTTVAVRAAVRHPGRVRGLLLAAGFAKADNRLRHSMRIWQDLLSRAEYECFARTTLLQGFSPSFVNNLPADIADSLVQQTAAAIPGGTVAQSMLAESIDITDDLARITVPTLIVNATQDLLVDPANSRLLASAIPGAEYTEIAAGHVLMAEQPELWWQTIVDFLDRHQL